MRHERRACVLDEEALDPLIRLDGIVLTGEEDEVIEGGLPPKERVDALERRPHVAEAAPVADVPAEEVDVRKLRERSHESVVLFIVCLLVDVDGHEARSVWAAYESVELAEILVRRDDVGDAHDDPRTPRLPLERSGAAALRPGWGQRSPVSSRTS